MPVSTDKRFDDHPWSSQSSFVHAYDIFLTFSSTLFTRTELSRRPTRGASRPARALPLRATQDAHLPPTSIPVLVVVVVVDGERLPRRRRRRRRISRRRGADGGVVAEVGGDQRRASAVHSASVAEGERDRRDSAGGQEDGQGEGVRGMGCQRRGCPDSYSIQNGL